MNQLTPEMTEGYRQSYEASTFSLTMVMVGSFLPGIVVLLALAMWVWKWNNW